jgi:hypothetical protein
MKNYYKERVEILTEQVELAKKGLVEKMKQNGIAMSNTNDFDEMCEKLEQVRVSVEAIKDLEQSLGYAKKQYEEECAKPENKKAEALETLYGGKDNG